MDRHRQPRHGARDERRPDRRAGLVHVHVLAVAGGARRHELDRARIAPMARFLLRRLLMLVGTLLVSSFLIFSSLYLAPGNPIATLSGGRALPPESVAMLEQRYHLDEPFLVRYWEWLKGVFHGDLGLSIGQRQDVSSLISARIWTTLELVAYASLIILVVGIGLGVLAGLRPGRRRHQHPRARPRCSPRCRRSSPPRC